MNITSPVLRFLQSTNLQICLTKQELASYAAAVAISALQMLKLVTKQTERLIGDLCNILSSSFFSLIYVQMLTRYSL